MRHAGVLLHRIAALAMALAVLGGAAAGALSWRLSQGPLELPWLTQRIETALNQNASSGRITIGSAALVWEGFRLGLDRPLDIRLDAVALADATGRQILTVPRAKVSLSLHGLLFGRTTLRALEIDQARINLVRAEDGTLAVASGIVGPNAPGPATTEPAPAESGTSGPNAPEPTAGSAPITDAKRLLALLTELARPPVNDRSATRIGPFSQLIRLRINDAALVVVDRQLGTTWQVPHMEVDLTRGVKGGVDGTASLTLVLGDQQARLTAAATLPPDTGPIRLRLRLTPVMLPLIVPLVPRVAAIGALGALDAPIGGEADLELNDAMRLIALHLALQVSAGTIRIADGVLPITAATGVADATADRVDLRSLLVTVPSHAGGTNSTVRATGWLDRGADHLTAGLGFDLDRVDFADLPRLWPSGVSSDTRAWITENMPLGIAHDGHVELGLEATPDLSDVTLTRATGTLAGDGLVVHWLRPVPPIGNGSAVLNILDPDTLEIVVRSGQQEPSTGIAAVHPPAATHPAATHPAATRTEAAGASGLSLRGGRVRITGIMHHDQFITIATQVAGKLQDAIALLREPRLQLLDKNPLPLNDPAGEMAGTLTLSFPLEKHLSMDQVAIRAHAHLDGAHLGGVIAGRDLDQGVVDLDVTNDGLTLSGTASLAGIPANLNASMDFRIGGPGQVLQRISVSGKPSARQLAAAGLDAGTALEGTVGLDATLNERRGGAGDIVVTADLKAATVTVAPLAWRKPDGAATTASARLLLSHDRLTGIENIVVSGEGVAAAGGVTCIDGKPSVVRLDRLVLGRTEARAAIRLPASRPPEGGTGAETASGPVEVSLIGPTLDLAARFAHRPADRAAQGAQPGDTQPGGKQPEPSGPHWMLDARFDRVIMAGDHEVTGLVARADSDGGVMRRLELDGLTGPNAPFSMRIGPGQGPSQGGSSQGGASQDGSSQDGSPQEGSSRGGAAQQTPAEARPAPNGPASGKRTLTATAANAGELLAGLDVFTRLQGGRLILTADYDDTTQDHALSGTAEITDFRIRGAPVLAHLLQAMTLYGLVELAQGPGLGFSKVDASFRLTEGTLTLTDARMFSPSLGLTARGAIDLDMQRITLEGTIVPAYFFNSLLGNIPLVGRLFSPEPGGGLFAASYAVHGPLDDPAVAVNPLSALTPGFLRGLFGLF
jgi:hypothetical protein